MTSRTARCRSRHCAGGWLIRHCPANCHTHSVQSFAGTDEGTLVAPDHEWRSYLLLTLVATDSDGARASTAIKLIPSTSVLRLGSGPPGAQVALDATSGAAPLSQRVIVGLAAHDQRPHPAAVRRRGFDFRNWSDGGAATHTVTAGAANQTVRARFR